MDSRLVTDFVRDLFAALNRRDYEGASQHFADDVTLAGAEPTVLRGRDAVIAHFRQSDALLPNSSLSIVGVLTGEAKVGVEFTLTGTQSGALDYGPGRGIVPPTGRRAAIPAFWAVTLSEGKIVSIVHYWDMYAMLSQLGLLPVPAPAVGLDEAQSAGGGGR